MKLHGVIMGEVMRVIMPTDNVHDAVDAVRQHGFAAIEGTQTQAVPFCRRLEEALAPYDDIEPITSFQCVANRGYLYLVVDLNCHDSGSQAFKRRIEQLDAADPGA